MMAKKKTELTPEEKLKEMLVPEEEQPYQVPENWCWVRVGKLFQINPKNEAEDDVKAAFVPMEKITAGFDSSFEWSEDEWGSIKKGHTQFADGDVAVAKISPCFENRKSFVAHDLPNKIGAGTTELFVVRNRNINPYYSYWLFNTDDFIQRGRTTYSGTVGQQRISKDFFENYPFPLPPLPEQQRIVDRIEELFSKLDEAKEKAQAVVDSYEGRKASILHKAFTGELTKKWRQEQQSSVNNWERTNIEKKAVLVTKGASPKWQGVEYVSDKSQTLFVTSENVRSGFLDMTKEKYLDNQINHIQPRSVLQKNDVLVNIVGASIGRSAIFNLDCVANINQAVCLIRLDNTVSSDFLCLYLNSPEAQKYYSFNKSDTARANISLTDIKNMPLFLPTISEQHEIVLIVHNILAKEESVNLVAEDLLNKIDAMKKSILSRAFRGELGTNDPAEASAEELLRQL